jgi:uncharacterized protein YdaU (DUF1376 family)
MATIDDLTTSITELPFEQAMLVILNRRNARRIALTEAQTKKAEKAEAKAAKENKTKGAKAKAKAKPKLTSTELASALSIEQKQLLLAELLGGKK